MQRGDTVSGDLFIDRSAFLLTMGTGNDGNVIRLMQSLHGESWSSLASKVVLPGGQSNMEGYGYVVELADAAAATSGDVMIFTGQMALVYEHSLSTALVVSRGAEVEPRFS